MGTNISFLVLNLNASHAGLKDGGLNVVFSSFTAALKRFGSCWFLLILSFQHHFAGKP